MLSQPLFTIQLAIHRPPHLLPLAVETVLAQTLRDFELVIICDGAPGETVAQAEKLAETDPRVQVRSFPKGKRRGEEHRAEVLRTARGRYVAHIADDDFWFPDHLAVLARGLGRWDFCHTVHVIVLPTAEGNRFIAQHPDIADAADRASLMAGGRNFIIPTSAGFRLDAYRKLPVGWSPAPEGSASDVYMWRKFLAEPWLRAGTIFWPTTLTLPNALRDGEGMAERRREAERFAAVMRDPALRAALRRRMVAAMALWVPFSRYPGFMRRHPLIGPPMLALKLGLRGYDTLRPFLPGGGKGSVSPQE